MRRGDGAEIESSVTSQAVRNGGIAKAEKAEIKKAETGTPTPLHHLRYCENSEGFLPFYFHWPFINGERVPFDLQQIKFIEELVR